MSCILTLDLFLLNQVNISILGGDFNLCWVLLLSHDLESAARSERKRVSSESSYGDSLKRMGIPYHNRHLFLRKCETLEQRINP